MADSLILLLLSGRNNSHDEISMISLEENPLEVWSRIKTFSLSISGAEIETVLVGGGGAEQFFGGGGGEQIQLHRRWMGVKLCLWIF